MKVSIEGIGTYHLILDNGHHLDLIDTFYVPSVSRNPVSLSKLDVFGFTFKFGHGFFSLCKNNFIIGSVIFIDGLYKLKLDDNFVESLLNVFHHVGIKRSMLYDNLSYLWHKWLGHVSKERLETLVKNETLPNLDFTDLSVCVDCINGKQTEHDKKGATRSTQLLEIVHTYI